MHVWWINEKKGKQESQGSWQYTECKSSNQQIINNQHLARLIRWDTIHFYLLHLFVIGKSTLVPSLHMLLSEVKDFDTLSEWICNQHLQTLKSTHLSARDWFPAFWHLVNHKVSRLSLVVLCYRISLDLLCFWDSHRLLHGAPTNLFSGCMAYINYMSVP